VRGCAATPPLLRRLVASLEDIMALSLSPRNALSATSVAAEVVACSEAALGAAQGKDGECGWLGCSYCCWG
jgi:hypothetical protein